MFYFALYLHKEFTKMELIKKDKDYIELQFSSFKSSNPLSRMSKVNRESLKEMVKYLTEIKKENLIDETQFSELISMACANYIENEVELRIEKTVNNKIFMHLFEKL